MKKMKNEGCRKATLPTLKAVAPNGASSTSRVEEMVQSLGLTAQDIRKDEFEAEVLRAFLALKKRVEAHLITKDEGIASLLAWAEEKANREASKYQWRQRELYYKYSHFLQKMGAEKAFIEEEAGASLLEALSHTWEVWERAYREAKAQALFSEGDELDGWKDEILKAWAFKGRARGRFNNPMGLKNYLLANKKEIAKELGCSVLEFSTWVSNSMCKILWKEVK